MLAHSKMYEYKDGGPNKPESASTVIDLKFASVREGRGTDRRFVFEIVTPSHGRRLYQALSEADMKTWIYALCNAIEACINGTSTLRSLNDVKKLAPPDFDDELELPPSRKGSGQSDRDRRLPIPPAVKQNASRHSLPAPPRPAPPRGESSTPRGGQHRQSLKNRIKSSAELAGDKLGSKSGGKANRNSMDLQQRPAFMYANSFNHREEHGAYDMESDIERRVYEMAGLQRDPRDAQAPSSSGHSQTQHGQPQTPHAQQYGQGQPQPQYPDTNLASLRALSPVLGSPGLPPGMEEQANLEPVKLDKALLRQIADTGANARCADCGKRTKSSRWATQSKFRMELICLGIADRQVCGICQWSCSCVSAAAVCTADSARTFPSRGVWTWTTGHPRRSSLHRTGAMHGVTRSGSGTSPLTGYRVTSE